MKVIVDRHRKAGLLVKQGHVWLHILVATPHGVAVVRVCEDQLLSEWSELPGYDIAKAVALMRASADRPRGNSTMAALELLAEAERNLKGEQNESD